MSPRLSPTTCNEVQLSATYCYDLRAAMRKQVGENVGDTGDRRRELKILGVSGSIPPLPTIVSR